MFLVDTDVISALAPSKRGSVEQLADWLDRASPYLFLSVILTAEVTSGIAKAKREGATAKASKLNDWWQSIEHLYAPKLLPFDLRCAHAAGQILDDARGHQPGFEDVAIAATAQVHELTVLTRNMRNFRPLAVRAVDPFLVLPPLP